MLDALNNYLLERDGVLLRTGPGWARWKENETVFENLTRIYPLVHIFDLALIDDNVSDVNGMRVLPVTKAIVSERYDITHEHCGVDFLIFLTLDDNPTTIPSFHIPFRCDKSFAKAFFDVYERMNTRPTLNVCKIVTEPHDSVISSNHCKWYPQQQWHNHNGQGVKIPHQQGGALCKNVVPSQTEYSISSLALELTLFRHFFEKGYGPPLGNVIVNQHGEYGYEVADVTKLQCGPIRDVEHAWDVLDKSSLILGSRRCFRDMALNTLNGYFVDGRRSPQDMYRWQDKNSLVRVPGVNMIRRKLLFVLNAKGSVWDQKARSIAAAYKGSAKIDIRYIECEPNFTSEILSGYDHVFFYDLSVIDNKAQQLRADGLIEISATISAPNYV